MAKGDGWVYVGEFKNGLPDEEGVLTLRNRQVYVGKWKKSVLTAKALALGEMVESMLVNGGTTKGMVREH